jgi:hypothetical protein
MINGYKRLFSLISWCAAIVAALDMLALVLALVFGGSVSDPDKFFATWWAVLKGSCTLFTVCAVVLLLAEIADRLPPRGKDRP